MNRKIILYLSVNGQESLENINKEVKTYCQESNTNIDVEYLVDSNTTYDAKSRRVYELIDNICEGDMVITYDLSTFGRGLKSNHQMIKSILDKNANVIFINSQLQFKDSQEEKTKFILAILTMMLNSNPINEGNQRNFDSRRRYNKFNGTSSYNRRSFDSPRPDRKNKFFGGMNSRFRQDKRF